MHEQYSRKNFKCVESSHKILKLVGIEQVLVLRFIENYLSGSSIHIDWKYIVNFYISEFSYTLWLFNETFIHSDPHVK